MKISFSVEGEFITDLARDWFYNRKVPYTKVKELLLSCMAGTDIPKSKLIEYVGDILKFKKKFIGNTRDNTFTLVEDPEVNRLSKYFETLKEYRVLPFEISPYGFINPEGKYIPVKWCEHQKWAGEYINSTYSIEEQLKGNKNCYIGTDFLVYMKNWILINNPQQGKGIVNTGKSITKKQKETLYDYYIFFNRKKEADDLYKEF